MLVKIQGGGDGVYANSGSCSAAVMYCEHERQELVKKGMNPETFFHQYSDFVSTREVIDRIDKNKKKLRKEDAKFFVITVNPDAKEQRHMGESIDERIAAFKNYIRNGVMAEYAKNFERGLTVNDIMYYAYVHVERGKKTGEQMHAHIIVSRRNMDNSISLSPKSNHRKGKGIIAHGFNRDSFYSKCERVFDNMLSYNRPFDESYEYRKTIKYGDYQEVVDATAKAIEQNYAVDLSDWQKFVKAQQTTDNGLIGFVKEVWNFTSGLIGNETVVQPQQQDEPEGKVESKQQETVQELQFVDSVEESYEYNESINNDYYQNLVDSTAKAIEQEYDVDLSDWEKLVNGEFETVNDTIVPEYTDPAVTETMVPAQQTTDNGIIGFVKEVWNFTSGLFGKKTVVPVVVEQQKEQKVKEEPKLQIANKEPEPVQPVQSPVAKTTAVDLYREGDHYILVMIKNGKLRANNSVERSDAEMFLKAKNDGNTKQFYRVCAYLEDKYLKNVPGQDIPDKMQQQFTAQEQKSVPEADKRVKVTMDVYYSKATDSYSVIARHGQLYRLYNNIDEADAYRFMNDKKSGNMEQFNEVCRYLYGKYLKNVPDLKMTDKEQQQSIIKGQKPQPEQKKIPDGLHIFKSKEKEHCSAVLYKDGKRVRFVDRLDKEDVSMFFKAKYSGNPEEMRKVIDDMTAKYIVVPLSKRIADDFIKESKNKNITSINAQRNHRGDCWIKHEIDGDWQPMYKIPYEFSNEINSLPTREIELVFNCINNLLIGAFPAVSCSGATTNKKRKRDEEKKKGITR